MPVEIPTGLHCRGRLWALQNDTSPGFVAGKFYGFVQQWLVFDDFADLDTAGCTDDQSRFCIINAHSQFTGGKATEYH